MYRSQIQKVECGSIALSLKNWLFSIFENFCFGYMSRRQHTFGTKIYDSRLSYSGPYMIPGRSYSGPYMIPEISAALAHFPSEGASPKVGEPSCKKLSGLVPVCNC